MHHDPVSPAMLLGVIDSPPDTGAERGKPAALPGSPAMSGVATPVACADERSGGDQAPGRHSCLALDLARRTGGAGAARCVRRCRHDSGSVVSGRPGSGWHHRHTAPGLPPGPNPHGARGLPLAPAEQLRPGWTTVLRGVLPAPRQQHSAEGVRHGS